MALNKLDALYRQVILEHSSAPKHFNKDISATHRVELVNATCGDVIEVCVVIDQGVVADATFTGHGCAISKASASMMMTLIIGQPIDTVEEFIREFLEMVQGHSEGEHLADASLLKGVQQFPSRIKCATLAWKALEQTVKKV